MSAVVLAVGVVVLAGSAVAAELLDRPFGDLSRDPAAAADAPFYLGALSIVTALVWWTGAAAAGVAALTLGPGAARPLALGAAVTAALGLDDALQIHEELLPAAGVSQQLVVLVYAAVALAFFATQRQWIARGPWAALLVGSALLAASAGTDVVAGAVDRELHLIEDGTKLLGAALWSSFFVRAAVAALRAR